MAMMNETHANKTYSFVVLQACPRGFDRYNDGLICIKKFEQHVKLSEVDEVCTKLEEKHKGVYNKDRFRTWHRKA